VTVCGLDVSVLHTDAEVERLQRSLELAWQLLFESGLSHCQRCMKLLLTLTHVRQCGVELTSWLTVVNETQNISFCDNLREMMNNWTFTWNQQEGIVYNICFYTRDYVCLNLYW